MALGQDLPPVGARLTGDIADLLAKIEIVKEAIKELKKEASGTTDIQLGKDLDKALSDFQKQARSGIISKAIKDEFDRAGSNATPAGRSFGQRYADALTSEVDRALKSKGPRWATLIGFAMPVIPAALTGLAGVLGGIATAGLGAAAGLGALGAAALEVLGPVKQAFTTIDQLTTTNAVAANATALQTWLKSIPTIVRTSTGKVTAASARSLAQRQALGGNLGFLTNPNVNYVTMTAAQRRALTIAAQSTTGMPTSESAQIRALMSERQVYTALNPGQQTALTQYTRFDQGMVKAQTAAQPAVLKVFGSGLAAISSITKYITPMADAAAKALLPLIKEIGSGFKSKGFSDFMVLLQKMATLGIGTFGQGIINVGEGIAHIFDSIAKSGIAQIVMGDMQEMTAAFKNDTGPNDKGFQGFIANMKKDTPIIDDIIRKIVAILGDLVKALGGGLGRAELSGINFLLGLLQDIAKLPLGGMAYNILAVMLALSKFGTLKLITAPFTALGKVLGELVVKMAATAIAYVAMWLGIDATTTAGAVAATAATGGIILGIAALAIGVYELYKHWSTVWAWIKKIAKDAWDFIYNGWGKYLLPLLGPEGLLILGVMEVWKHWNTIWGWITGAVKTAWDGIKAIMVDLLKTILTDPGTGILWMAQEILRGISDAFGWVPFVGGKLKTASNDVAAWVTSVNKSLGNLDTQHTTTLNFNMGKITGSPLKPQQKASGGGAQAGLAWVGEQGPELVHFHGGETVYSNSQSKRMMGYAKGTSSGLSFATKLVPLSHVISGFTSVTDKIAAEVGAALRTELQTSQLPGGGLGASGPGVAAAEAFARRMLPAFGWAANQMAPLINLWTRESGWRWNATNPSSGAYGIPQSLPANKMASAGADWLTNPATQIRWGLGYIRSVYGSPAGAWAHEMSAGWYGRGTISARPGLGVVGEHGPELVKRGYLKGIGSGGGSHHPPYRKPASSQPGLVNLALAAGGIPYGEAAITDAKDAIVKAIEKFYKGAQAKWRIEAVNDIAGKMTTISKKLSAINATIDSAKSFQSSTATNLASGGLLSNLPLVNNTTMTGIASTTVDLKTLQAYLAQLKQFGAAIKQLAAKGLSKALIQEIVNMGVTVGLPYAQAILAGGGGLIGTLNKTEAAKPQRLRQCLRLLQTPCTVCLLIR